MSEEQSIRLSILRAGDEGSLEERRNGGKKPDSSGNNVSHIVNTEDNTEMVPLNDATETVQQNHTQGKETTPNVRNSESYLQRFCNSIRDFWGKYNEEQQIIIKIFSIVIIAFVVILPLLIVFSRQNENIQGSSYVSQSNLNVSNVTIPAKYGNSTEPNVLKTTSPLPGPVTLPTSPYSAWEPSSNKSTDAEKPTAIEDTDKQALGNSNVTITPPTTTNTTTPSSTTSTTTTLKPEPITTPSSTTTSTTTTLKPEPITTPSSTTTSTTTLKPEPSSSSMSSSAITKTESDLPVPTTTSSSQADLKLPEAESVPKKIITEQNDSSDGSAKSNSAGEESTQSIIPTKPFTSEKASINGTEHQLNVDRGFQNSTSQIGILTVANSNSAFSNKTNPKKDLRPDEFISQSDYVNKENNVNGGNQTQSDDYYDNDDKAIKEMSDYS